MTPRDFEIFDTFTDGMNIHLSGMGATLVFQRTLIPLPGQPPTDPEKVANIRMTAEHLKFMTYAIHKQILELEAQTGVRFMLGRPAQESAGVDADDWNRFWGYTNETPAIPPGSEAPQIAAPNPNGAPQSDPVPTSQSAV